VPNWKSLLEELNTTGSQYDVIRRKYLRELYELTGRNVIVYYSGWLQKPGIPGVEANDNDKNGFMAAIHELDRTLGLDLLLHTPGGDVAATESLVDYLRSMFGTNIRAIIPQLAMSAGTMVACACKEIVMGKESSLGPIDPQVNGIAAHGVIEEFSRAMQEVQESPNKALIWQPIIGKYSPTLVGECQKSIQWADTIVRGWLKTGMFADDDSEVADLKASKVLDELASHALTLSHARHISLERATSLGLNVIPLEQDG
jgi:ClpP class serine protease